MIRYGYSQGAFPMTMDEDSDEIEWFQPTWRALFPLDGIRVSRSLAKTLRRTSLLGGDDYEITFDTAFEEVMRACRRPDDNWISESFVRVYTAVHHEGWAHSVEVWKRGDLVGGSYGIALGTCFCAESMFHRETNCSKIALWALVNRCRELGFTIFDAQVMNPHLESLGAYEVHHADYMADLEKALRNTTLWSA